LSSASLRAFAPPGPQTLLPRFCKGCLVRGICGEADSDTACVLPAAYPAESLHPVELVRRRRLRREFEFPSAPAAWAPSLGGTSVIVANSIRDVLTAHAPAADLTASMNFTGRSPPPTPVGMGFLHGEDRLLEQLWKRAGFYADAFRDRFEVVVAPAFSTWWEFTPLDGLVAVSRTAQMAAALARRLPTIPTVCWRNARDIVRWVGWLAKQPPSVICVHASTRRGKAAWSWGLEGIRILGECLVGVGMGDTALLAYGPSTAQRVREVSEAWPGRLMVASQHPYQLARSGRELDGRKVATNRDDLVLRNGAAYEEMAATAVRERS